MPYFLDANCFKRYVDALLTEANDVYYNTVTSALAMSHISTDDGGIFVQEWKQTTGGAYNPFVDDLISTWLAEGKIKLLAYVKAPQVKNKLKQMGVPKLDARIIEFSVGSDITVIISEDIDLYEPSAKGCPPMKRAKLICGGKGSISQYVRKNYGIETTCCCHF